MVGEALDAGLELVTVLATPDFLATPVGRDLGRRLPYPALEVEPRHLDELADADSPRGVVATARLERGGAETLPVVEGAAYLYVEGMQDPGNLGALTRTAEASGCAGMALSPGTVHPNHPRALRASAGSLFRLPVACSAAPEEVGSRLSPLAPRWVALVPREGRDLWEAALEGALVVAVGAEGPGLSEDLLRRSHDAVTLAVAPPVESLNVTVAAAVVLFEVRRRRRGS